VRILKILVMTSVIASVWILTLGVPRRTGGVWAQLGAPPAPLPAPPAPPGAAPAAGGAAIPGSAALAPAPGSTTLISHATPTPATRIYNCSCFNTGTRVRWIGQVTATSFFTARQSAVNSCVGYTFNRQPSSAYLPPPQFGFFPRRCRRSRLRRRNRPRQTWSAPESRAGCKTRPRCQNAGYAPAIDDYSGELDSAERSAGSGAITLTRPAAGDSNSISARWSQKRPDCNAGHCSPPYNSSPIIGWPIDAR